MSRFTLAELTARDCVSEELTRRGLTKQAGAAKAELFARAATALRDQGVLAGASVVAYYVPGRIEVLGKHTDYAGGRSLLAAPERGVCMVASPRRDDLVRVHSIELAKRAAFPFRSSIAPNEGDWSNYAMTAARRLAGNFGEPLQGADISLCSDLPIAAGMSSSSALLTATCLSLVAINRLEERDLYRRCIRTQEELASYLGCVENGQSFGRLAGQRGVGTFGGSEDHTAMLCCDRDVLKQYAYCPVRYERTIRLPDNHLFAIACSGVVAEKTGAAMERYNRLSRLASEVLEQWRTATGRNDPHLAAAVASSPEAVEQLRGILASAAEGGESASDWIDRFEQFYAENEQILPSVPDRLDDSTLAAFGRLVDCSQQLAENLLSNQTPETVHLAVSARELGAAAASAFGAGFGGSVWALVEKNAAERFLPQWRESYVEHFPVVACRCEFFATPAGPAAMPVGA